MKALGSLAVVFCMMWPLGAQVAAPPEPNPNTTPAPAEMRSPAPANLGPLLMQLEQAAQSANLNLARLRIEKWKADGDFKRQSQDNANSLQRNISAALPSIIAQVRGNPDNLAASFKLYRNVNVLYDVLESLTESAGAFGPKSEFEALSSDAASLDSIRRALADSLEQMASARDAELARLRSQTRQAPALRAAPTKRIVVDDTEPAKKPARKKKPAPPSTAAPAEQPK